ncbi:MAG: hypothetical protein ACI9UO_002610 [Nitrospinales bacterium]|jgi:hypothetical protein
MAKQGELIDCPGCSTLLSSMLPECPDCDTPINKGKFSFGGKAKKKANGRKTNKQAIDAVPSEKPHSWEAE